MLGVAAQVQPDLQDRFMYEGFCGYGTWAAGGRVSSWHMQRSGLPPLPSTPARASLLGVPTPKRRVLGATTWQAK
jgi:hypothetical protein